MTGSASSRMHVSSTLTENMMTNATRKGANSPISVPRPRSSSYSASMSFVTRVMTRPTATRS